MDKPQTPVSPWRQEFNDVLRGIAGAFLFGTPLLYTMEVWWKGSFISPGSMLAGLALTYGALVVLDRTIGFRKRRATTWARSLTDSAEALAIGLICGAASLVLIRVITSSSPFEATLGQIVLESVPFGLGVGIANGLIQQGEQSEQEQQDAEADQQDLLTTNLADAGATVLGATVVALSISPTDEVPMITAGLSPLWLLVLVAASLALSYVIVFEANFVSQQQRAKHPGLLQSPIGETVFSYLLSLVLAALLLWFFQQLRFGDPWTQWLSYTLVLGLPATIGGAAGRLAV